jgi:hypothetical protein
MAAMAERAVAMAREAPEDPHAGLADPGQLARGWDLAALELCRPSARTLSAADAASFDALCGRGGGDAASCRHQRRSTAPAPAFRRRAFHMAASNGFSGGYGRRSSRSVSCGRHHRAAAAGWNGTMGGGIPHLCRPICPMRPAIGHLAARTHALARVGSGANRRLAAFRCCMTNGWRIR